MSGLPLKFRRFLRGMRLLPPLAGMMANLRRAVTLVAVGDMFLSCDCKEATSIPRGKKRCCSMVEMDRFNLCPLGRWHVQGRRRVR